MPQDPLFDALQKRAILQGPPPAPDVQLPDRPDALSEVERLIGVATGFNEPKRGNWPDLVAGIAGMLPIGRGMSAVTAAKRVAPRAAAKELANVLLGRSARVAAPVFSEENALMEALMRSKAGGPIPPAPTRIRMHPITNLTIPGKGNVAREPGLTETFKLWQRARGQKPRVNDKFIYTSTKTKLPSASTRTTHSLEGLKNVVKRGGSVQQATNNSPLKIKTERELIALLDGPRKAMASGVMPREEGMRVLTANKAKIDEYFEQLKRLDHASYDETMQQRIANHYNSAATAPRNERFDAKIRKLLQKKSE